MIMARKKVAKIRQHCADEINVVYERYMFNRRVQRVGETLDDFAADLQRLARNCEYGELNERMICDQIVYGVRDDATRLKLLQTVDLDLRKAIDVCTASETAGKQQRDASTPEAVDALSTAPELIGGSPVEP